MMNDLPLDHPLRRATWIWPGGQMYIYNQYAQFRKDFDLSQIPDKAPLFITADAAYRLYLNGRYGCRGPARGYQAHWPFDEIDAAGYLKPGHNWISVMAYNPGISTFQYRFQGTAGFLFALSLPERTITSDPDWDMRRAPGMKSFVARLSLQMGFQEHVDASLFDCNWIEEEHSDLSWDNAPEKKFAWDDRFPYGRPPYETLEPRGIPLLRETLIAPGTILCTAGGPCADGYRDWDNVSWGWVREAGAVKTWNKGDKIPCGKRDGALEFTLQPTGRGNYFSVTLDAGEYLVGTLVIEAYGAQGGEILDSQHHENMVGERPDIHAEASACQIALANRLYLRQGLTRHEFFHPLGFHYFTLILRDSTTPITIRVQIRSVGYPFTMKGKFECSDQVLNEIHAICRRTQQVCALDAYVDTPWREQAQWWGDARVQAKNTFYLDGDARLLARGIRSIARQSTAGGLTYGHAPTVAYSCILPDFSLTWILTLWDYYWQTGDIGLFQEQWHRVQEVLGYFDTPEARGRRQLLRHDRRFWFFGDWADLYKGDIPTLLNLWYLLTLRRLADLVKISGMLRESERMIRKADIHEKRVMRWLYDPAKKIFAGGLDENGKKVFHLSIHDQVLALMLGLAPEAHDHIIQEFLLPYLRSEKVKAALPSAFWCTYLLEEMGRRGYGDEVIAFIKKNWTPMLETGTTWEMFEWSESTGSSISHAWAAHPSYHFVNILAGIYQEAPAWTKISVRPEFIPGINRVSVIVPSPKGEIAVSWERREDQVSLCIRLPEGVEAEANLPGARRSCPGGGEYTFSLRG